MDYEIATAEIAGETLLLHPFKAVFWPKENILLIADLHLGKVGHFRKGGIAVPENAFNNNWGRLETLMQYFNPAKVIFLGDLFHSHLTHEWRNLEILMAKHAKVHFELVVGNHDILPPFIYHQAGLKIYHEPVFVAPFLLSHDPLEDYDRTQYNLCGHIHPGVVMGGGARQFLRLPCFFFTEHQGILPAFGELTGLYALKPKKADKVYVVVNSEVVAV